MGLLGSLFTRRSVPLREPRDTTDDALNAVFVPLRNGVCDFKDITNMSWALILPAIQRISIRLFIQALTSIHATIFGDYDKQNGEGARHCPERRSQH
jgi:hypothetical protein